MRFLSDLGGIFLRGEGSLQRLEEHRLSLEGELQQLLVEYPDLIPTEEIDPDLPTAPLLVAREAPLGGMQLDHLFIDARAVPLLIECKPAYNRQQRREVVAQMLDYAASAHVHWNADVLQGMFAARCHSANLDPSEQLAAIEHEFDQESGFWQACEANLRAGHVRLLFAADHISEQLRLIVEFLNERMTPTEVLAMEVIQYRTSSGEEMLQARLVGRTERAVQVKGGGRRPDVLGVLLEALDDPLQEGAVLWFKPEKLPQEFRPADAADERLKVILERQDGTLVFRHQTPGAAEPTIETPSKMWNHIRRAFDPSHASDRARSVSPRYSLEPGGPNLGEVATQRGLWE